MERAERPEEGPRCDAAVLGTGLDFLLPKFTHPRWSRFCNRGVFPESALPSARRSGHHASPWKEQSAGKSERVFRNRMIRRRAPVRPSKKGGRIVRSPFEGSGSSHQVEEENS